MIMNLLVWNIRGLGNSPSLKRLKKIIKTNNINLFSIIEPKIKPESLKEYVYKLNCFNAVTNQEGNIWVLWKNDINFSVLHTTSQYISIKLQIANIEVIITFV